MPEMIIHLINQKDGRLLAFEIENTYVRPKKIAALLRSVDEASDITLRKPFSSSNDIHLKFKYLGEDFIVWEPYGDSSRYWIGPKDKCKSVDISDLAKAFEDYKLPIVIKFFGDILTLKFLSSFKKN